VRSTRSNPLLEARDEVGSNSKPDMARLRSELEAVPMDPRMSGLP
jgi:hypothetical protein